MTTRYCWLLLFTLLVGVAYAQAPLQNATTEELLEKLTPASQQKTRSLSRNMVVDGQASKTKTAVDLVIQFDFGSAQLLDASKPLLDSLAKAMNANALANFTFNVEGHTDSVGSASFNQQLSDQRATAVVNYLVARGVTKNRLVSVGKGSADPLTTSKPDSPENRRVRIIVNS